MDHIHICICEDRQAEQNTLIQFIKNSAHNVHITCYTNGESLLSSYKSNLFDLIILDIYMDGMTGVEVATKLREYDESVLIAFSTTSDEHTLEGYRLNVIKYLEKPVSEENVFELLRLASLHKSTLPKLSMNVNGIKRNVSLKDVLYMEQSMRNILIYYYDGTIVTASGRLSLIEEFCTAHGFFRSHKSYLVNLAFVHSIDKDLMVFEMTNGVNVHIRRGSFVTAKKAFETYLFETARSYM